MKRFLMVLVAITFIACSNSEEKVVLNQGGFYRSEVFYSVDNNELITGKVVEEGRSETIIKEVVNGEVVGQRVMRGEKIIASHGILNNRLVHGKQVTNEEYYRGEFYAEADIYYGIIHGSMVVKDEGKVEESQYHYGMLHGIYKSGDSISYYNKGNLVEDKGEVEDLKEYDLKKAKNGSRLTRDDETMVYTKDGVRVDGLYHEYSNEGYTFMYIVNGVVQELYSYTKLEEYGSENYILSLRIERNKDDNGDSFYFFDFGRLIETQYFYDDGSYEIF